MARACAICKKQSLMAGGYSNRVRATKYNPTGKTRRQPNLQWSKNEKGGRHLICAKCLKRKSFSAKV